MKNISLLFFILCAFLFSACNAPVPYPIIHDESTELAFKIYSEILDIFNIVQLIQSEHSGFDISFVRTLDFYDIHGNYRSQSPAYYGRARHIGGFKKTVDRSNIKIMGYSNGNNPGHNPDGRYFLRNFFVIENGDMTSISIMDGVADSSPSPSWHEVDMEHADFYVYARIIRNHAPYLLVFNIGHIKSVYIEESDGKMIINIALDTDYWQNIRDIRSQLPMGTFRAPDFAHITIVADMDGVPETLSYDVRWPIEHILGRIEKLEMTFNCLLGCCVKIILPEIEY